MLVKKFEAPSLEKALALVKQELGPDALILSTQQRRGGMFQKPTVEVTAAVEGGKTTQELNDEQLERVFPHRKRTGIEAAVPAAPPRRPKLDKYLDGTKRGAERATDSLAAEADVVAVRPTAPTARAPMKVARPKMSADGIDFEERTFLEVGLSGESSREFGRRLRLDFPKGDLADANLASKIRCKLLAEGMKTLSPDIFDARRCWAAIGPAGSGKTSLLVKLAIYLKNRRQSVQLISCDDRKIAGRRELAAYAKLVGVSFAAESTAGRSGSRVQLLDTPSLCWRDPAKLAETERQCRDASALLVLDASQRLGELIRTVERCSRFGTVALAFTRLDSISQFGVIHDVLRATKLPLLGLSTSLSFKPTFRFVEPMELAKLVLQGPDPIVDMV